MSEDQYTVINGERVRLIDMEIGTFDGFRIIESPLSDFAEPQQPPFVSDFSKDTTKRWGNHKYKAPLSLKKTRARIANKSKRRNRK